MQTLGLSQEDFDLYVNAICVAHERRVWFEVTDLDGNNAQELEPFLLSGQIDVASRRTPTRIMTARFVDPHATSLFEPDSVVDAPIHRSKMIVVHDERYVPALERWVDCVPFTGICHKYDREGAVIDLVAHGKEIQAMGAHWTPRSFRRKKRKDLAIRRLMADTGETRMRIPQLKNQRLVKPLNVLRLNKTWPRVKKLARTMNRQAFYDGPGVFTVRRVPTRPVFTFLPHMFGSEIKVARNPDGIHNVFLVIGRNPKGPRKRVTSGPVFLPKRHEHSAFSLRRNGQKLHLVMREKDDQWRSDRDCTRRANDLRDAALRTSLTVSAQVVPFPFFDEKDPVRSVTPTVTIQHRLTKWTLPLTGELMDIGANKKAGGKPPSRRDTRRGGPND